MQLTFLREKFVAASWNKIISFTIPKHYAKHFIVFPAVKNLGACVESLWIRVNFLYDVRW